MTFADRVLGGVIRRVRRDPNYTVAPDMSLQDLLTEFRWRGLSLIRGLVRWGHVAGGWMRFVEPGVRIRHARHLTIGNGCVIETHAQLHCLSRNGVQIGRRVTIGKFAIIECTGVLWHLGDGLSVGDDSTIGDFAFVGCSAQVTIGQRVLMGPRVSFHPQNHDFSDVDVPIKHQGVSQTGIQVGDDCWLGSGSIILDGVAVGDGAVVAAGSVVTRDVPAHSVVAGVPAKIISSRT